MPTLTYDNDSSPREAVPTTVSYRQKAMLNNFAQLETIKQYVTGTKWSVDYYNQVLAQDDELMVFDPSAPISQQQVVEIKQMSIFVTSPLEVGAVGEPLSGAATVVSGITANQGDSFYASVSGDRPAVFTVTQVSKKTYNLDNVYDIEYELTGFVDDDPTLLTALTDAVVKTYYAEGDFLQPNGDRLLLEEDYHLKKELMEALPEMANYYLKTMLNREYNTITLPGQEGAIVDVLATDFFMSMINSEDSIYVPDVSYVVLSNDEHQIQPTIWSVLSNSDPLMLKACNKTSYLVDGNLLTSDYLLRGFYYMGIDAIVYPYDVDSSLSGHDQYLASTVYSIEEVANPYRANKPEVAGLFPDIVTSGVPDNSYVFTENFYNEDTANMTVIETLAYDYIQGNEIDTAALMELIEEYRFINRLQQYYFIPVILMLTRYAVMGMRSIA